MRLSELKKQYYSACKEYVYKFCIKQDMEFMGWVGDEIGGIALCNDFFFNFNDIVLDINTHQPIGAIISWYYDNLEYSKYSLNYYSYTKGLRVRELAKEDSEREKISKSKEK